MTQNSSLRHRVRRLEEMQHASQRLGIAAMLSQARARRHAKSPDQLAAWEAERDARCFHALAEPDIPAGMPGHLAQQVARRRARRLMAEGAKA